ncbi:MAG: hypothetical protein AAB410_00915 [Patescibacteria group bacterium]
MKKFLLPLPACRQGRQNMVPARGGQAGRCFSARGGSASGMTDYLAVWNAFEF